MNGGVKKTGCGVWCADQSYVSIIVDLDTTYGTYEIESNFLTIITTEEESDEYYGNRTIVFIRLFLSRNDGQKIAFNFICPIGCIQIYNYGHI